jgi:hypothetical protein
MSRFKQKIRIDPKQLEWIRENKGAYKTLAGKLDEIINFYKKHKEKRCSTKQRFPLIDLSSLKLDQQSPQ